MRIFKLSLGSEYFNDSKVQILKNKNLISVHPNTAAKGQSTKTQGQEFLEAKKGDVFYVCRSNNSIEFIGMFTDERPLYSIIEEHDDWVDRSYIQLVNAADKTAYNKALDKWWTPRNNSTFAEVPKSDQAIFEKEILQPVFNCSLNSVVQRRNEELDKLQLNMQDYLALQIDFKALMNDEKLLFNKINELASVELNKIYYSYLKRGDVSNQPVVLLRKKLLEQLLNKQSLDDVIINQIKKELDANFETNAYHAWSSNYRVLYTFLYDRYKEELESFFKNLIKQLQKDLELEIDTKVKFVHLDGPQNQGFDRIWFAIYNKVNKSQKLAKQLFFEVFNGFKYGLLNYADTTKNDLKHTDTFTYDDVLNTLKLFKQEVLNDKSMEKAKLADYIEILKQKKQIILQGPPGTGKTYTAKKIAKKIAGKRSVASYNTLTPELIMEQFEVGQKIASSSGKQEYYTINAINNDTIELQSEFSKPWKPKYNKIIHKYNQLVAGETPTNINALDPYELAVAKYLFDEIKPSTIKTEDNYTLVQFHPSYTYEDFVRGITVKNEYDKIVYKTENKVLVQLSRLASKKNNLEDYNLSSEYRSFLYHKGKEAKRSGTHYYFNKERTIRLKDVPDSVDILGNIRYETLSKNGEWYMQTWMNIEENYNFDNWKNPEYHTFNYHNKTEHYEIWKNFDAFVKKLQNNDYVLIIDEINRANLPSVLGELIYALEYRGEAVESMYAIDGDATITIPENLYIIGTMNTADRSVGHIDYAIKRRFAFVDVLPNEEVIINEKAKALFNKVSELFTDDYLASDFDVKDVHLGHSYFLLEENSELTESERLQLKLDYEILPILNEYVKDGLLLETAKAKIKEISEFEC